MFLPTEGSAWYRPTPPPRRQVQVPGYTPDYAALMQSDPFYRESLNDNALSMGQAGASRDELMNFLRYGYNGAGNRFSDVAQAERAYKQAMLVGTNTLAGRGMLHSGERPWMNQNLEYQKGLSIYNAGRAMTQGVMGANQSYLAQAQQAAMARRAAAQEAYGRLSSNPLYQPSNAPQQASLVGDWERYGKPVYKDAAGQLWEVGPDGKPIKFGGQ